MAWSFAARRQPPLPGCELRHINCANCPRYALTWHAKVCASLDRTTFIQPPLFDVCGGQVKTGIRPHRRTRRTGAAG